MFDLEWHDLMVHFRHFRQVSPMQDGVHPFENLRREFRCKDNLLLLPEVRGLQFLNFLIIGDDGPSDIITINLVVLKPAKGIVIFLDDDLHFFDEAIDHCVGLLEFLLVLDVLAPFYQFLDEVAEFIDVGECLVPFHLSALVVGNNGFESLHWLGVEEIGVDDGELLGEQVLELFDLGDGDHVFDEQAHIEFEIVADVVDLLGVGIGQFVVVLAFDQIVAESRLCELVLFGCFHAGIRNGQISFIPEEYHFIATHPHYIMQAQDPQQPPQWSANLELAYSQHKWKCDGCWLQAQAETLTVVVPHLNALKISLSARCIISTGRSQGNILIFIRSEEEVQEFYDDEQDDEYIPQELALINRLNALYSQPPGDATQSINLIGNMTLTIAVTAGQPDKLYECLLKMMAEQQKKESTQPVSSLFNFQQQEQSEEEGEEFFQQVHE